MAAGVDPRLPVLVGVGQVSQRVDKGAPALEPVDLMVDALRRAEDDTQAKGVLAGADAVRVICELSWRYVDPAALVAQRVGAAPTDRALTVMGGNYVQTVVNQTALDIQAGRHDLVLLTGGEAWRTRSVARTSGDDLGWTTQSEDTPPARVIGTDDPLSHPTEVAAGLFMPVQIYPMFDIALRAKLGLSPTEHRERIARLWSRFSQVASENPNAWIQTSYSPDEIAEATPDNRMIGYPYTKRMNSNNAVEQGAGLILCSVERAEALGIPRDRWVFLHSGADAHDHRFVSNRHDLCSSPAIRLAGRAAMDLAGTGSDDLAHIDLYSCFPSAVQVAAAELDLDIERQLTVTGGMSFAGGPWNNYVMHGIATMAGVLRNDPGSLGMCTANGGYLTKHAFGVYCTDPPRAGRFRFAEPQAEVDALPQRELAEGHTGAVTVESYTVMHDRDGSPERALVACLTAEGSRTWGATSEPHAMRAMVDHDVVGRAAHLVEGGEITLS